MYQKRYIVVDDKYRPEGLRGIVSVFVTRTYKNFKGEKIAYVKPEGMPQARTEVIPATWLSKDYNQFNRLIYPVNHH